MILFWTYFERVSVVNFEQVNMFELCVNLVHAPEAVICRCRPATLLKRDSHTVVFCEIGGIFKNTFFKKTSPVATWDSQFKASRSNRNLSH